MALWSLGGADEGKFRSMSLFGGLVQWRRSRHMGRFYPAEAVPLAVGCLPLLVFLEFLSCLTILQICLLRYWVLFQIKDLVLCVLYADKCYTELLRSDILWGDGNDSFLIAP